jgi:hypothetical protein
MESRYILGIFEGEEPLLRAFRRMKEEGIPIKDVITPYPVHEILENHGRKSKMTYAAWLYGLLATLAVLAFLTYTAVIDWPLNYGGKPSNAFPSFMVVTIVLTIFSVTILSLFTFSWRANLWPSNYKPIFHEGATDDKFVILIEKSDVDENKATGILKEMGAIEIIDK